MREIYNNTPLLYCPKIHSIRHSSVLRVMLLYDGESISSTKTNSLEKEKRYQLIRHYSRSSYNVKVELLMPRVTTMRLISKYIKEVCLTKDNWKKHHRLSMRKKV